MLNEGIAVFTSNGAAPTLFAAAQRLSRAHKHISSVKYTFRMIMPLGGLYASISPALKTTHEAEPLDQLWSGPELRATQGKIAACVGHALLPPTFRQYYAPYDAGRP